jgi:Flp pilus assembly pilin Flp
VVAISVLLALGGQVKTIFSTITSQLQYAGASH